MSNKTQNIVSNVFGLLLWIIAAYLFITNGDYRNIIICLLAGILFFFYKVTESKDFFKTIIDWYFGRNSQKKQDKDTTKSIGDDLPLPDEDINPI